MPGLPNKKHCVFVTHKLSFYIFTHSFIHSFIHSVICLTTGRLFQNEFSSECDLELPVSISSTFFFSSRSSRSHFSPLHINHIHLNSILIISCHLHLCSKAKISSFWKYFLTKTVSFLNSALYIPGQSLSLADKVSSINAPARYLSSVMLFALAVR
jgi:hypothetical protein